MEASRASSSSAPVTFTMERVLPKGSTVLISFLVMSPAAMEARMPPPLVTAASTSVPSRSAPQTRASQIRSPRLVSSVRLPGSFSPFRATSVFANTVPYSLSISAWILAARAATSASVAVRSATGVVAVVMVPSASMVTTPTLSSLVPVEVTRVSPTFPVPPAAAFTSSRVE